MGGGIGGGGGGLPIHTASPGPNVRAGPKLRAGAHLRRTPQVGITTGLKSLPPSREAALTICTMLSFARIRISAHPLGSETTALVHRCALHSLGSEVCGCEVFFLGALGQGVRTDRRPLQLTPFPRDDPLQGGGWARWDAMICCVAFSPLPRATGTRNKGRGGGRGAHRGMSVTSQDTRDVPHMKHVHLRMAALRGGGNPCDNGKKTQPPQSKVFSGKIHNNYVR